MTHDRDLIRELLTRAERQLAGGPGRSSPAVAPARHEHATIKAHVERLGHAGFVDPSRPIDGTAVLRPLTWQDHGCLDTVRDEAAWVDTTRTVRSQGLGLTVDVGKRVAAAITTGRVRSALRLPPA